MLHKHQNRIYRITIWVLFSLFILFLNSCDKNHEIGIENLSSERIEITTIQHIWSNGHADSIKKTTILLPEKIMPIGNTIMGIDSTDIIFDCIEITSKNKNLKICGRGNILHLFEKDNKGNIVEPYYIIIKNEK